MTSSDRPAPASRDDRPAPAAPASGLAGRDFLLLLAGTLGMFSNHAVLLSVVPLFSVGGGAGHGGAGAATATFMAATVLVQLGMGRLTRRFGARPLLVAGALLLGVPAFGYAASAALPWVLAVSAVRGAGFGIVTVAGAALVAALVAPDRRGRALGLYGLTIGLPQVLVLPAGLWAAGRYGFVPVFVAAGIVSVLAVPLAAAMSRHPALAPDRTPRPRGPRTAPSARSARRAARRYAGPWTSLFVSSCAFGGVASFLPLALDAATAAVALLALSAAIIAGRWTAGVWSDRAGAGRLAGPGVVAGGLGMAGLAAAAAADGTGAAVTAVAAATLYGLGFGLVQNDTLVVMFQRSGPAGHGSASAAWNIAFDAGTGAGGAVIGLLSGALGISVSFAAAAAGMAAALPLAWLDARRGRVGPPAPRGDGGAGGPMAAS
ncbi:MFS transporter [Spirillospora sp. NPDC029432]|uniref:MFS transporter n=1 Tax=Spirillospora sp. NPDC029432 TaxID=3154599 RepID=UPI003452AC3E